MNTAQRILWIVFLIAFALCLALWHDQVQPEAALATVFITVAAFVLHFVLKKKA